MEYQYTDNLKLPKNKILSSYYIVDKDLRYVSLYESNFYILTYVDSGNIGETICESNNEYDFDYFVIAKHFPISSVQCTLNQEKRYLELKTCSGNFKYKKARQPKEDTILSRYNNKNKQKLF